MPAAENLPTNRRVAVVVEGDAALRRLMTLVLERAGVTVYSMAGETGLETYLQHRSCDPWPFVLIADLDRPGGVGLHSLELLRRGRPALPIVIIAALGDSGGIDRARRVGAVQVLEKPFELLELRRIVVESLDVCADREHSDETAGSADTQGAA